MGSYRNTDSPTSVIFFVMAVIFSCPLAVSGETTCGINVKDFGAVGDGKTDDTDAIQKAVLAAMKTGHSIIIREHRPHPGQAGRDGGAAISPRPEIVFPEGTYRITRPIVLINYAHVRGLGTCVIKQSNPKQDIIYFAGRAASVWEQSIHLVVRGLRFEGGKTQIRIFPQNINATVVSIDDCEFADSADYPVVCRMYAYPEWPGNSVEKAGEKKATPESVYWPPYVMQWKDGLPYLQPNPAKRGPATYDSTLLKISNCTFDNTMGVMNVSPDTTFIRDCRVTVNPRMDGPIFNLEGSPHLYRVRCVASPAEGKNPYWIKGGCLLSIRECEFDTATEHGIDFIRIWDDDWTLKDQKSSPWNLAIVEDTRVKSAGGPSNALVRLGKRCQPNVISLIDVKETSGRPVKAVAFEAPEELADLKNFRSTLDNVHPRQLHKILLARNSDNISEALPPIAGTLREEPPSKELLAEVVVPEFSWRSDELWSKVPTTLNAADHGLDADPETDDTNVVQTIFDAAAGKGVCEVVFPAGVYLISEPIRLPENVLIRGAGLVAFRQSSLEKDIFHAPNARRLGFRDVLLKDGRYGIDITPAKDGETRVAFTDCWFTDQAVGVRCMPADKSNAEILIEGGYIDATQAVVSSAETRIEAVWVFNGRNLENQGFFENHGQMRLQAVLGVPSRYRGNVMLENPRWVDNFGAFQSLDTRYGGEGGGFCNVYNRSADGTVYITGGVSRSRNPAGKKCLLYLEQPPKAAVLQSISTTPWFTGPYEGSSTLLTPRGETKSDKVHITGLLSPDTVSR
ncbi:MAG: hypothetical protein JXA11_06360 [Phycisphaerae bacterium]|nr:hypothetical protein [Phycisphaerae bacterium]